MPLAYAREGKNEATEASFESALRLGSTFGWIYVEKGLFDQEQGHLVEALSDFGAALQLDPRDARALRLRAAADHAARQTTGEIADLTALLVLDPRDEFALEARALAESASGDNKAALGDYDDWIRYTQSAKAYESRSRLFVRVGDYARALEDLRQAVTVGWTAHSAAYHLAWLLATCPDATLRNGPEAVEVATKACEATNWQNLHCLEALAAAQAESGDFAQAIHFERRALILERNDPSARTKMEARLALYRDNMSCREPAPDQGKGSFEGKLWSTLSFPKPQ